MHTVHDVMINFMNALHKKESTVLLTPMHYCQFLYIILFPDEKTGSKTFENPSDKVVCLLKNQLLSTLKLFFLFFVNA